MDACRPTDLSHIPKKVGFRARRKLVSFQEIATMLGRPSLATDWGSWNKVPVIDCTSLPQSIFRDSAILNDPVLDMRATTEGSVTTGSAGTFATYDLLFTDLANFTAFLLNTQISSVTETTESTLTEDIGAHTFEITTDTAHNSDPTAGWLINLSGTNTNFIDITAAGSGEIKIHGLNAYSSGTLNRFVIVASGTTFTGTISLYKNLYDGRGSTNANFLQIDDVSPIVKAWNNKIWDIPGTVLGAFHLANGVNGSSVLENNTVSSCVQAITNNNLAYAYKNFMLFGNTANFAGNTNSTSENCATDKASVGAATDNNPQVDLVVADQVYSEDDTNARFMQCKISSACGQNGASSLSSGNTTGGRGNARPGRDGATSIGEDEALEAIGPVFASPVITG